MYSLSAPPPVYPIPPLSALSHTSPPLTECRVQRPKLDVAISNSSIGVLALNIGWHTTGSLALSPAGAEISIRVLVGGVGGIEPKHVAVMVIPQTHDEHHAIGKRLGHVGHAALLLERVAIAKHRFLLVTELGRDGVAVDAGDGGCRLCNCLAALHVEALDLQVVARANELRDDGELLRRVDCLALAVEILDSHAVAVEVAAVLVADALVAVIAVTAVGARASNDTRALAGVGSVCGRDAVSLPDVHLSAAGASGAGTGVGVVGVGDPAGGVGLAVDPLDVVRALGVAVS